MTDYAVVLATHMAIQPHGETHNVAELSTATAIPQPTVAKVLKQLVRAGVVASRRGTHGGYGLAKAANEISIAEVVEALEGPIAVTECSHEETEARTCEHQGNCGVQANWQRINNAVQKALEGIRLIDMIHPATPHLVQLSRLRDTSRATHTEHK